MTSLFLFDVDGTICNSGQKITDNMINAINNINIPHKIGIVGGGSFDKITYQLDNKLKPHYIFSECGSVYHILYNNNYKLIYKKNIRNEKEYLMINKLLKISLNYISKQSYLISGNFIDLRNGLIYISLVGMCANQEERKIFINLDKIHNYRQKLLSILLNESRILQIDDKIDIVLGGSVGIAIYPKKWNKSQVLEHIDDNYKNIYFFGDKYESDGNDYPLISHNRVDGIKVDNINDTINKLNTFYNDLDNSIT